ncbi:MAG: c-type cytochrome [Hyphomicrobium sp.]
MKNRTALGVVALIGAVCAAGTGQADDRALTIDLGSGQQRYTAAALLARPDVSQITVPNDVSYHRTLNYRAVPLLAILKVPSDAPFETLETRATDGFVSQIPLSLVRKGIDGGSQAWIALEDPAMPWPNLPGKDISAGPFYLVWEHPDRSGIGSEQWPYALAAITGAAAPARRWPQMAVGNDVPAGAPARRGQEVFSVQCLPCHRMKGAGAGDKGPDLGRPMNPTKYMTPTGLRMLIRNPKSVRTWPELQMPGFDNAMISDHDLEALIAYLTYMAETTARSPD